MGAAQAQGKHGAELLDESESVQDDVFPWFHVVQWCAEDAGQGVFKWDLERIQKEVALLTTDEDAFLTACPEELPRSCPEVTVGENTTLAYMEWAEALLEWNEELRKVRFKLVPKRMKEAVFWSRYFAGVRRTVQKTLFHGQEEEDEAMLL
eukprot:TRINITY_DN9255_c0_g2_i1.p1 TRINITY_DN9255_c0_g2~~TRINITY_DN9255_c0_g2_i1.p1  ORF type:complete len:151 (-),score=39.97 TRINITY_DN9255_c0_g2_i1:168-620(-)